MKPINPISSPLSKLFQKEWHDGTVTKKLIEELKNHFEDIKICNPQQFTEPGRCSNDDGCIRCVIENVFNVYLIFFLRGKHVLDERFADDEVALRELFSSYGVHRDTVWRTVQLLTDLRELIVNDPDMMGLYFTVLVRNHPDVTPDMVKMVLNGRVDLNRDQIRMLLTQFQKILDNKDTVNGISVANAKSLTLSYFSESIDKLRKEMDDYHIVINDRIADIRNDLSHLVVTLEETLAIGEKINALIDQRTKVDN